MYATFSSNGKLGYCARRRVIGQTLPEGSPAAAQNLALEQQVVEENAWSGYQDCCQSPLWSLDIGKLQPGVEAHTG